MNRLTHWVDRALPLLVSTTLILGALLVWARTWELSCWALLAPGVASAAIAYGLFQHRWHRKRSVIEYYLADDGKLRGRLRRSWLTAVTSAIVGLSLGMFLAVFVALSRPSDWAFLAVAAVVAPLFFVAVGATKLSDEFSTERGVADVIVARLAGWVLLAILTVAFVHLNYSRLGTPEYICVASDGSFSMDALLCTGTNFAAGVSSACPLTATVVRLTAWIEGISWWLVTSSATDPRIPDWIAPVAWIAFFTKAALAFTGLVRGLEGCMLLAIRLGRNRDPRA